MNPPQIDREEETGDDKEDFDAAIEAIVSRPITILMETGRYSYYRERNPGLEFTVQDSVHGTKLVR